MNPKGTCVTDAIGLHIPEPGSFPRTWFLVFLRVSFSPRVPQLARTSLDILQPWVCRILASLPSWSRLYQGWSKHEHPLYSALPGGCPSHHSSAPAHALELLPHQTPVYGPIGAGQRASRSSCYSVGRGRGHHAGISSGLRDSLFPLQPVFLKQARKPRPSMASIEASLILCCRIFDHTVNFEIALVTGKTCF